MRIMNKLKVAMLITKKKVIIKIKNNKSRVVKRRKEERKEKNDFLYELFAIKFCNISSLHIS
jgi:hypothetical protein